MTAPDTTPETAPTAATPAPSWRESMEVYLQPRVIIVLLLGFSSGLPLALSGSTLQVWMREAGVDLGTIGLFALIGTPYTLKFLWAPLVDALHVPLFTQKFGRRRGWLLLSQLLLIGAILLLALADPARSPFFVAFAALLVAAASSTQDIVVDAFRVESLPESEQAAGMAAYVAAYRIGMLVSTAGALVVVSGFEEAGLARNAAWMWGYVAMAALVSPDHFGHELSALHDPERWKSDYVQSTTYHPASLCFHEDDSQRPAMVPCRARERPADVVGTSSSRRLER